MIRFVLILLSTTLFNSLSIAGYYAIAPCDGETPENVILTCEARQLDVLNTVEGYIIVKSLNSEALNDFCFFAEVKQMGHHVCFNRKSLLVKLQTASREIIDAYALVPHKFIPNLYACDPDVKNETELGAFKNELEQLEEVAYVGFNQVFTLEANVNDPLYARQWAIENNGTALQYNGTPGADMSVDSAWTITTGSPQIKIAVLDSGVDTLHEDLSNNLLPGFDGFASGGADTHGYPTPNYPGDGHGTSCAGIIAAEGDNGLGIAGVAYESKIIPVRIFYYLDYGPGIGIQATSTTDALLNGFSYAWRIAGADIISASAGLNSLFIDALGIDTTLINAELTDAFWQARNWKGIAMFFSSGNDDLNDVLWPANLNKTIAVGASSMCDERKSPSDCSGENWGGNYDLSLDVVAPGVKISTTDMTGTNGFSNNAYTYTFNGTSASCPNAAAVGALILSVNNGLQAEDVRAILNITADRVSGYVYDSTSVYGTWNSEVGHGRVNAYAAVQLAQSYQSSVGVSGINNSLSYSLFPNPTNDQFTIVFNGNITVDFDIVDLNGHVLVQKKQMHSAEIVDIHNLASGVYLVQIYSKNGRSQMRLIKK